MDTITIKTNDNAVIEMEVVLTYQNNGVDYVIYKDDDNVHYIAKYNHENEELNTYLSDEEISFGEQVLNEVIDEVGSK